MDMKRNMILLMLATLCALSCNEKTPSVTVEGYTFFTADMDQVSMGTFRQDLVWEEGSYIGVYGSVQGDNERYIMRKSGQGLSIAEFYGYNVKGEILAYSPYEETFSGSAEQLPLYLSPEQTLYYEDWTDQYLQWCPTACAILKDGTLDFHRPCGLLVVTFDIPETLKISSLRLSAKEEFLAGRYSFMKDGSVKAASNASGNVVLKCFDKDSKDVEGNVVGFPVVMLPGDYASIELEVVLTDEEPFKCLFNDVQIRKMTDAGRSVTMVAVTAGGIEGFTPSDGYLEK